MTRTEDTPQADLSIIIVSTNEARWLEPCLRTVFEHAGGARLDVVVVDNESTDGTRELVETEVPRGARGRVREPGLRPRQQPRRDDLDRALRPVPQPGHGDRRRHVRRARRGDGRAAGRRLAGVRQLTGDGTLWPTIRYFPSVGRALGRGAGVGALAATPGMGRRARARPEPATSARSSATGRRARSCSRGREALLSAGLLDERFFIYSEEPDLCLRMKRAGWRTVHLPGMTIVHHADKGGVRPRMVAQDAYTRRQYAHKHFSRAAARGLSRRRCSPRHAIRAIAPARELACPARGREARDADARRSRGAAVRHAAADCDPAALGCLSPEVTLSLPGATSRGF